MDDKGNNQETLELHYFQKLQVQKLEIRNLNIKIGQLQSEIDHLNYVLERVHEPISKAKKLKRKYDDLMYQFIQLKGRIKP